MVPDYVCQGCGKACGGDVGAAAFLVTRETPREVFAGSFVILCAACWNAMARPYLGEHFLDAEAVS